MSCRHLVWAASQARKNRRPPFAARGAGTCSRGSRIAVGRAGRGTRAGVIGAGFALPRDAGLETGAPAPRIALLRHAVRARRCRPGGGVVLPTRHLVWAAGSQARKKLWQRTPFAARVFGGMCERGDSPLSQKGNDQSELAEARRRRAREFRLPARSAGRSPDGAPIPTGTTTESHSGSRPPTAHPDRRRRSAFRRRSTVALAGLRPAVPTGGRRSLACASLHADQLYALSLGFAQRCRPEVGVPLPAPPRGSAIRALAGLRPAVPTGGRPPRISYTRSRWASPSGAGRGAALSCLRATVCRRRLAKREKN